MNSALVTAFPQLLLARLGPVGRVGPDGAVAILLVQHLVEDLAVVHAGIRDRIAPDQLVLFVDVDVVLVAVVALAVLLGPACILVLLPLHVGLVVPTVGRLALLDLLVLVARVSVLRHINRAGIDNLAALRYQPGCSQPLIEALKELVNQTVTRQLSRDNHSVLAAGKVSSGDSLRKRWNDARSRTWNLV